MDDQRSLLCEAVAAALVAFCGAVDNIFIQGQSEGGRRAAFDDYDATLGELKAKSADGSAPLRICFDFIGENLDAFKALPETELLSSAGAELLNTWSVLLLGCLGEDADNESVSAFLVELQRPEWPVQLPEERAYALVEALLLDDDGEDLGNEASATATTDTEDAAPCAAADVVDASKLVLDFAADLNPELREAFINEVPGRMGRLSEIVLSLADIHDTELRREILNEAQRQAHTIKGSSNITGVYGLATLTHVIEDIFEICCDHDAALNDEAYEVLVDATDIASTCVDYLQSLADKPEGVAAVVDALAGLRQALQGDAVEAMAIPLSPGEQSTSSTSRQAAPEAASAASESVKVTDGGASQSIHNMDVVLNNVGELSISTVQLAGFRDGLRNGLSALVEQQDGANKRLSALEKVVALRGVKHNRAQAHVSAAAASGAPMIVAGVAQGILQRANGAISDHNESYDSLELDQYNELHSTINVLAEALTDMREMTRDTLRQMRRLDELLIHQERVSRELSDTLLASKMVQPRSIESRLARIVRQTCRATGKDVALNVVGADVDMDAESLVAVTDPLMHLLRNAIDHGVESTEQRAAAGKPAQGSVTVEFIRDGDQVVVRCVDDGRGFDFDKIRERAMQMRLITAEQTLSDSELARLTLVPGFSTRDTVDQVSGRGIGLDVVAEQVNAKRGQVEVESVPGEGSVISMRLSMQLTQMQVLLVQERGRTVALPIAALKELVYAESGDITTNEDGVATVERQGETYELISLASLLGYAGERTTAPTGSLVPVVVVEVDQRSLAVSLEKPLNNERLVIKRLSDYMPHLPGFIGGAVLGDGSVAPVVDVRELVRLGASTDGIGSAAQRFAADIRRMRTRVLVVDDSLSARRTMAQVVADAGYEVNTAVDGLDAAELLGEWSADLVLTDLEMPRMNGIELTRHLRGHQTYGDVPVIMLTSRTTQKHRDLADVAGVNVYMTKPFSEDDIVEQLSTLCG